MSRTLLRRLALSGLPVLYILHNDFWLWNEPRLVLGLPVGLLYHAAYCVAASALMALLVASAWPAHLEVDPDRRERR